MKESILQEKSLQFGVRMVKFAERLEIVNKRIIANQILRSGTSIGANIAESCYAASRSDFVNKLKIAEKETGETAYWLKLVKTASLIDEAQYKSFS